MDCFKTCIKGNAFGQYLRCLEIIYYPGLFQMKNKVLVGCVDRGLFRSFPMLYVCLKYPSTSVTLTCKNVKCKAV